jgi:acyl-CoA thioesterase FadM
VKRTVMPFVYQVSITKDLLDELGHANYNKLKDVFETARHRLCKFLGFGRKTLRTRLNMGLVMIKDSYEYYKPLKEGDVIFFLPKIVVISATRVTISLRVCRLREGQCPELTNEATYEMAMVDLCKDRPARFPKGIVRSVDRFHTDQAFLMGRDNRK